MSLLCEGLLCFMISVKRSLLLVEFLCGYMYNHYINGTIQVKTWLMFYVTVKNSLLSSINSYSDKLLFLIIIIIFVTVGPHLNTLMPSCYLVKEWQVSQRFIDCLTLKSESRSHEEAVDPQWHCWSEIKKSLRIGQIENLKWGYFRRATSRSPSSFDYVKMLCVKMMAALM